MFKAPEFLDHAKAIARVDTDYKLSKVSGIGLQSISNYRTGRTLPDELAITKLCALSGDDPAVVAAQVQAARAKDETARKLWQGIALKLQTSAVNLSLTLAVGAGVLGVLPSEAYAMPVSGNAIACALCQI